jgi:putative MATE family efflux protein
MKKPDMLSDTVASALFRLVLPLIPGTLSIVLFNVTDTYFVGQLGAVQLAAMSFSFPVVLVSGGLSMGLGIGTAAYVSQTLGRGERKEAARVSTLAFILSFLIVFFLAVAGLFTIELLFSALGATSDVLPFIRTYMTIWYIGMPFVILPMVGNNILQSTGDTKIPGIMLTGSVVLNIVLDPLLIFGLGFFPEMGMAGAALATVIARGTGLIVVGIVIVRREKLVTFTRGMFRRAFTVWGKILYVGLPAAAANILLPISMGVVTRMISDFGTDAVAGFGAATRVESFALVFTLALSMIVTPFVGQNLGAGRHKRIVKGYRTASLFSLAWGAMVLLIFLFFAHPIASIFNDDPRVVSVTANYLKIVGVSYGFLGIVNLTTAAFNGLRKPLWAAAVAFVRLFAFYIPLAAAGKKLFGLDGIFYGAMAGNVLGCVVSFLWFTLERRKARHKCRGG